MQDPKSSPCVEGDKEATNEAGSVCSLPQTHLMRQEFETGAPPATQAYEN